MVMLLAMSTKYWDATGGKIRYDEQLQILKQTCGGQAHHQAVSEG